MLLFPKAQIKEMKERKNVLLLIINFQEKNDYHKTRAGVEFHIRGIEIQLRDKMKSIIQMGELFLMHLAL